MTDRIFIIDGGKTFHGTLEQFAETFAAYGTIVKQRQIIDLCVEWQCDLYWSIPDSELVGQNYDRHLHYVPDGSLCVGVLEGRELADGTMIYDMASGLQVMVVNSAQAVALNADGTISYIAWRKNGCWTFSTPDTWSDEEEETNTEDLQIVGYANRTALHPVGSYIGFEPGPTVFATPVVYLSEAQEKIDNLQTQVEVLKETLAEEGVRQFFKAVVAEAKRPAAERGQNGEKGVLHCCAIPSQWFNTKSKQGGRYLDLTDDFIDNAPLWEVKFRLALFIANCYQQR